MIISAGNQEVFDYATPIGVGMIESTMNLTQLCLFDKPKYLVFIGSAGSYTKKRNLLDIVLSSGASNIELGFLQNSAYTPIDNVIVQENVSHETIVNSSNYITTNFTLAQGFLAHNIEIENMEFFSVMSVAKAFEIPAFGIFILTNYTNTEAHSDYQANINEAMQKLNAHMHQYYKGKLF